MNCQAAKTQMNPGGNSAPANPFPGRLAPAAKMLLVLLLVSGLLPAMPRIGRAAGPSRPVLLFDRGHRQPGSLADDQPLGLSRFLALGRQYGFDLRTHRDDITLTTLQAVDALVISGPFAPFSRDEIHAIGNFLYRGGRLALMLHVADPAVNLLHQLGVAVSNSVIRERTRVIDGRPRDFRVTRLADAPLTRNLKDFAVYGCWALFPLARRVRILARSGPRAWIDLNGDRRPGPGDACQSFAVLVAGVYGRGRFAVFGDDAIFQNRFLKHGNLKLAANLLRWLRGRQPGQWVNHSPARRLQLAGRASDRYNDGTQSH